MAVDAAYANLFGVEGKAAVLGCDELGLVPRDLLHVPKKSLERTGDDKSAVLVRYTLMERARQNNIRKVLAIKNRLIADGDVQKKWKERCKLFPDAPGVPKIPKAMMEKFMTELDTESDDDDNIDELGLNKPRPQYGVSPASPVTVGAKREPSIASSLSSSKARCSPDKLRGWGSSTMSNPLSVSPKEKPLKKNGPIRKLRKFWKKHAADTNSGKSSPDRLSDDKSVRSWRPKPPPDPPFLPPLPYPRRDAVTLKIELEELNEYRQFLLRYAHDSSAMAKEYYEFTKSLQERSNTTEKFRNRAASCTVEGSKFGKEDGSTALWSADGGNVTKSALKKGGISNHKRQLDAYVRLARLEVQRNISNYKKWNGFMEEMEGVEPVGTIAADVRARLNVGKLPSFEEYVLMVDEKASRREKMLWNDKRKQEKLNAFCEAKDRHTEENIEKIKRAQTNLFMESQVVQSEIKRRNRECENRRRRMREHRVQVGLAKKELGAAERHMKRLFRAKEKRFEHDAEEIFRRLLKEKLHAMDAAKRWDIKSVRAP
ncbi:hypothetical protein MOQ_002918 [Trypanosoma cruzi marinkellei]|uniref:Uncharacterized protein n=1 Tax=Trypanosoma cruzi marinkellei TaxID=85056 RepID=K2NE54_TRYCR|nr:hypothetical protein MOQ_002918 [Trypanosoma cruzi marinkellei]